MASVVIPSTGFPKGLDREELITTFMALNDAVKNTIPAKQIPVYGVK
jgi:hypothetical protein